MMTVGVCERARGVLLVTVGDQDRGIHPHHNGLTQVTVAHPGGRDPPMPCLDQPPHVRGSWPGPGRSGPAGSEVISLNVRHNVGSEATEPNNSP
jgi:hypothetical protein